MICKAVDQKNVDVLVLGRRGMGTLERIIVGSTSKYCLENASCNVFIAKSLLPAAEIHSTKEYVVQLGIILIFENYANSIKRKLKEDAVLKKKNFWINNY